MIHMPDARACVRAWLAVTCLVCAALPVQAGQVRLSPLSLSLTPDQRATTVTLRNETRTPVSLQVRVFAWQQDVDAGMLLAPTPDVVLSPAMVTLAPGATQLVRVVSRAPEESAERYFRVLIDELPDPGSAAHDRIRLLTRYSLPLFLEPRLAGLPRLSLRLQHCQDGRRRLVLANAGERRARIADWRLLDGEGGATLTAVAGLAGYVLPGSELALPLPPGVVLPAQGARLETGTDLGPWQADVGLPGETAACQPANPG